MKQTLEITCRFCVMTAEFSTEHISQTYKSRLEYGNKINDLTHKIKILSREISEKSSEIDKSNENVRLKEMEKMEISRK